MQPLNSYHFLRISVFARLVHTLLVPDLSTNLVTYFGHSPGNSRASLQDVCNDLSVDVVILGFVRRFYDLDVMPYIDFVYGCNSNNLVLGASQTPACAALLANITFCQNVGKKVFLSIGGSSSNTTFADEGEAIDAAQTLWDFFGPCFRCVQSPQRPFGDTSFDGFDIDVERQSQQYYDSFAASVRQAAAAAQVGFYLSASYLCTEYAVAPLGLLQQLDFIWPRFWNAAACRPGTAGFYNSLTTWKALFDSIGGSRGLPKFYLGLADFAMAAGRGGYVAPDDLLPVVQTTRDILGFCFGGMMLWDGTNGLNTTTRSGVNFIDAAKSVLLLSVADS